MTRGPVATFRGKKSPAGQFELSLETLRILVDGLFPIFHPLTPRSQSTSQGQDCYSILSWAFHSFGNTPPSPHQTEIHQLAVQKSRLAFEKWLPEC